MNENKDIATRGSNLPANEMAGMPSVLRSDILIPYLSLMQGLSDAVKDRKAQMGDFIRSTTLEKVGDPDHGLDIIFLHYPRSEFVLEQKQPGKTRFEFRRTMPRNAANETLPWTFWGNDDGEEVAEGTRGATEWRRVKRLSVLALLPKDLEAARAEMAKAEAGELPDPNKALTPLALSFRVSSYKAGKEICSFWTQCASMKVPMWKYSLGLSAKLEQNDDGSFYVWQVSRAVTKPVPKEFWADVEYWANLANRENSLQVHEEGEQSTYTNATEVAMDVKATVV